MRLIPSDKTIAAIVAKFSIMSLTIDGLKSDLQKKVVDLQGLNTKMPVN